MNEVNGTTLLATAGTLELCLRGLGHGLAALGQRVARLEREASAVRAGVAGVIATRSAPPAPRLRLVTKPTEAA